MRPSNEFTTEQQRFFYPINNEMEHHESLDTAIFPAVLYVEGKDHFVVIEKDGVEEACDPYWNHSNIPEGSVIKQVAGLAEGVDHHYIRDIVEGEDLKDLNKSRNSYVPQEGEQVVVKLNRERMWRAPQNANIPEDGIFILPHDATMPTATELSMGEDTKAYYEFVGFINADDKLVVPIYLSYSPMRGVVDWCVANAIAQNRLEHALLVSDLPFEATLTGMLKVEPKIAAYLKYFDEKHRTHYFPESDPKDDRERFPELTEEQRERYFFLSKVAHRFLTEPRHQC